MTKRNKEFENFDRMMSDVLKVPHDEIKAKLEAEKKAKKHKGKATPAKKRTLK